MAWILVRGYNGAKSMDTKQIDKIFSFQEPTREQLEGIAAVYRDAKTLAESILIHVPPQHCKQALLQLSAVASLCRQGIEVEAVEVRPLLVI